MRSAWARRFGWAPPARDPALLDAYKMIDHEQTAWWRDRLARVRAELDCPRNIG